MASRTRFELDRAAWDRAAEEVGTRVVDEGSRRVLARAVDIAPVFTSDYVSGLDRETGIDAEGPYGRVFGRHWSTWIIELGSPRSPAFAPLRRALDSVTGGP